MPTKGGDQNEQQALLSLIQKVEGEEWASTRNGWKINSGIPVCDWDGISCRIGINGGGAATITSINLVNEGLSATLPSELGWLADLEELNLKGNLIAGTIPQELANLEKLFSLDLTNNQITGSLPQWWGSFTLSKLFLAQNQLTGEFFHNIYSPHLQSMQEVRLENNKLVGTLDGSAIMQMQKIETISLSQNDISGLIPGYQLGSLPSLKFLYLDNNELVGPLPSQLAQMGKSSLEELWVQSNYLSGTVPASMVRFARLHDFFIDGNKLTGALPLELCSADLNHDFFSTLPADSERNYCEYIACPAGSVGKEGVYPCSVCPGGDAAKIKNPYLGKSDKDLQCSAYSQRDILRIIYESTSQSGWFGGSDWNDATKPVCQMTGIMCDDHENIVKIGLKNRNLSGTIPDAIGFLSFLETLDLSDNNLEGFVPSDLRWTSLTRLDISGNKLRGVLPPLLCMMQELNGNGENNVYYCDRVACPANTFNAFGHHGYHGEPCKPCYDVHQPGKTYIGQKTCLNQLKPASDGFDWKKEIESLKESSDNVNVFSKVALSIATIAMAMLIILLASRCCMCGNSQRRKPESVQERKRILRQSAPSDSESSSSDSDDEEDPNLDVELSSVVSGTSRSSRNAMDLINEHKGIALSRQEKVKKAISRRLPQAQGIRSSISNINVNARKQRFVRRASRGSLDGYDDVKQRPDGYDDVVDFTIDDEHMIGYNDSHEDASSVENNFGEGEATIPKKKQETDLLDIPMIT
jgi:Leucine-rich repeat (LRR) protein